MPRALRHSEERGREQTDKVAEAAPVTVHPLREDALFWYPNWQSVLRLLGPAVASLKPASPMRSASPDNLNSEVP